MEPQDCQICLEKMAEGDLKYPILCPEKCGFNFCLSCVEHLIESSEHDYEEASDGNRHVKVKLQCPQCRGSLVNTIRDTRLMRKALIAQEYADVPDSELNATELCLKHEFVQVYAKEVEHAQLRLRKFQKDNDHGEIQASIKLEPSGSQDSNKTATSTFKDETLFQGMDYCMSNAEQSFVTELLISGDPNQLAQAAQIMHGIMQISLQGLTPSTRTAQTSSRSEEMRRVALLARFRKSHPLPARMPKYTVLGVFNDKKPMLLFKDEEWDGSIADAYTRVHGQNKKNMAVDRILSQADSEFCSAAQARVKIKSVKGQAGRVGLQKGDVVTHINAEPWEGTADELSERIYRFYEEDPNQTFSMVVNAEPATAEVLKLRGQACQLVLKDDV